MCATSLELRAATSLVRAWQLGAQAADARAALADACAGFASGEPSAELAEARALLAELESDPPARTASRAHARA